jgi:tRNA U54 and U55 pseudouridine synthase Pus10
VREAFGHVDPALADDVGPSLAQGRQVLVQGGDEDLDAATLGRGDRCVVVEAGQPARDPL